MMAPVSKAVARHAPQCILLVDDDPTMLETYAVSLRDAGYEVLQATDGVSALNICMTNAPQLAVIDYAMPGLSGIDLARQLVAQTEVPFLFLSVHADDTLVREAVAAGAMTYLVKPLHGAGLIPPVRTALERSREVLALRSEAQRMSAALKIDRSIGVATGLVMARFQLCQQDAFERLRRHARSQRVRLEEVAMQLLRASEETARVYDAIAHESQSHRSSPPGS
jgi:two-component system, response regulator PdtaR